MKLIEAVRKMFRNEAAVEQALPSVEQPLAEETPVEEQTTEQSLAVQAMLMSHSCCG